MLVGFASRALCAEAPIYFALRAPAQNVWRIETRRSADAAGAPFLSSLPSGENATGVLRSKAFTPPQLAFYLAGHSHQKKNFVRLLDARSREVLRSQTVPANDVAQPFSWDLRDLDGRRVRLQLEDGDDGNAYAWLSFGRLQPPILALSAVESA